MLGKPVSVLASNQIPPEILQSYGKAILELGRFEWMLAELIMVRLLNTQIDIEQRKDHRAFNNYISQLSFDKKIQLIREFDLFSSGLCEELETVRRRRVIFVHGIVYSENDELKIHLYKRGKKSNESLKDSNLSEFHKSIMDVENKLVTEFRLHGFQLMGRSDPI